MRRCDECTLCCNLLGVMEINKPAEQWCPKCAIGKGCQIYNTRPGSCKEFQCIWLSQEAMPEEFRPDKIQAVFWESPDPDLKRITLHLPPGQFASYQTEPIISICHALLDQGFDIAVMSGDKRRMLTLNLDRMYDRLKAKPPLIQIVSKIS